MNTSRSRPTTNAILDTVLVSVSICVCVWVWVCVCVGVCVYEFDRMAAGYADYDPAGAAKCVISFRTTFPGHATLG